MCSSGVGDKHFSHREFINSDDFKEGMTTETIEAVWRNGRIIPLEEVEVENNTHVVVTIPIKENKSGLLELAGVWKNDDETYDVFKKVIKERENFKLRPWPSA